MKNKKWIILSILMMIGIILSSLGFFMGAHMGVYFNSDGVHLVSREKNLIAVDDLDDFQSIQINVKYANIQLEASDHYGLEILSHLDSKTEGGTTNQRFTWKLENQALIISENTSASKFNFSFGFFVDASCYIKVYFPKDANLTTAAITSTNGDIKLSNGNIEKLDITSSYGNITVNELQSNQGTFLSTNGNVNFRSGTVEQLKIDSSYGNIQIKDFNAHTSILTSKNGDVKLQNYNTQNLAIESEYGNVKLENIESKDTTITSKNGNTSIQGNLLDNTTISSQYGDIKVQTKQLESYYSSDFSTKYGNISIKEKKLEDRSSYHTTYNNGKTLLLNSKNGNVKVEFGY